MCLLVSQTLRIDRLLLSWVFRCNDHIDFFHFIPQLNTRQQTFSSAQGVSQEKRVVATTGKLDAKRHLSDNAEKLMSFNIVQNLATMLDTVVF